MSEAADSCFAGGGVGAGAGAAPPGVKAGADADGVQSDALGFMVLCRVGL